MTTTQQNPLRAKASSTLRKVSRASGVISFAVYNFVGIKQHGWKYIYQFMGPSLMEKEIGGKHYHIV